MSTERPDESGPRRRRTPLAVVSVAAAVLIAGGGGAYLATNASGDSPRADAGAGADGATPPPLDLDGHTEGVAPGEPAPGGVIYRAADKLPDGPDSAPVYRAKAKVDSASVAKLAEALDVKGSPRAEGNTWRVGNPKDGPLLQVGRAAPGAWTYTLHRPSDTDNCPKGKACTTVGGSAGTARGSADDSKAVSEAAAKKAAAPVLKALGLSDAKTDAEQTMGAVRVVNADPVIGGLPTYGWSVGIQVGPDGVVSGGSGRLSEPVKGAEYPVAGAEKTLERLNSAGSGKPRGGIGGCASAVPQDVGSTTKDDAGTGKDGGVASKPVAPCAPDGKPTSSGKKPAPVDVRSAEFGLAVHFENGRHTLVPSWLYTVRNNGSDRDVTLTHPAVEPKFLAAPRSAEPTPAPTGTEPPRDGTEQGPRSVRPESYDADGRTLTLKFWGGVCSKYSADAKEKGDRVEVRITGTPIKKDTACIMIAKQQTVKVTLDKPLGDREVVGSNGTALPKR
ncbi:hypothetical protein DY218_26635 [Streptomyces triticagri]|uniref:Large membrane protein n=1 Tax=Streptomyces triticagri TaxID=2293568 RepID=A0A372LXV3_9ACTN|nr:hypothetical protein [Streptomyces triticagri]RFU83496.1 hypothetical protein DY218_26635 [Streptomyces triticagri]